MRKVAEREVLLYLDVEQQIDKRMAITYQHTISVNKLMATTNLHWNPAGQHVVCQ